MHDSRKRICGRKVGARKQVMKMKDSNGFALVEVLIATVVVGIGISMSMYGFGAAIRNSHAGRDVLLAGILAGNIEQYSRNLAFSDPQGEPEFGPEEGEDGFEDYDDIDDLDGLDLSPPIGADGEELTSFDEWTQRMTVVCLDPDTFEVQAQPTDSPIVRVEVELLNGSRSAGVYQWIVTNR